MARSVAGHGGDVRMDDLPTMCELVQELSRMEPLLRESQERQVLNARPPQVIHGAIDPFPCEPPAYRPALQPSPQTQTVQADIPAAALECDSFIRGLVKESFFEDQHDDF